MSEKANKEFADKRHTCEQCLFATWPKEDSVDKDVGRCGMRIPPLPSLPNCMHWTEGTAIHGGMIERHRLWSIPCPYYTQKQKPPAEPGADREDAA